MNDVRACPFAIGLTGTQTYKAFSTFGEIYWTYISVLWTWFPHSMRGGIAFEHLNLWRIPRDFSAFPAPMINKTTNKSRGSRAHRSKDRFSTSSNTVALIDSGAQQISTARFVNSRISLFVKLQYRFTRRRFSYSQASSINAGSSLPIAMLIPVSKRTRIRRNISSVGWWTK